MLRQSPCPPGTASLSPAARSRRRPSCTPLTTSCRTHRAASRSSSRCTRRPQRTFAPSWTVSPRACSAFRVAPLLGDRCCRAARLLPTGVRGQASHSHVGACSLVHRRQVGGLRRFLCQVAMGHEANAPPYTKATMLPWDPATQGQRPPHRSAYAAASLEALRGTVTDGMVWVKVGVHSRGRPLHRLGCGGAWMPSDTRQCTHPTSRWGAGAPTSVDGGRIVSANHAFHPPTPQHDIHVLADKTVPQIGSPGRDSASNRARPKTQYRHDSKRAAVRWHPSAAWQVWISDPHRATATAFGFQSAAGHNVSNNNSNRAAGQLGSLGRAHSPLASTTIGQLTTRKPRSNGSTKWSPLGSYTKRSCSAQKAVIWRRNCAEGA